MHYSQPIDEYKFSGGHMSILSSCDPSLLPLYDELKAAGFKPAGIKEKTFYGAEGITYSSIGIIGGSDFELFINIISEYVYINKPYDIYDINFYNQVYSWPSTIQLIGLPNATIYGVIYIPVNYIPFIHTKLLNHNNKKRVRDLSMSNSLNGWKVY